MRLAIWPAAVQMLDGALEAIELGCVPAGLVANREFAECVVEDAEGTQAVPVPAAVRTALYDPQTAGGLLISVAEPKARALVEALRAAGYAAAGQIGVVVDGSPKIVLG